MTGRREFPEEAEHLGDWYLQSSTGELVAKRIEDNKYWDVTPLLPGIQTPTLVLHRIADPNFPRC
jgi:hypothetical protein